jgi:hypothetical protein
MKISFIGLTVALAAAIGTSASAQRATAPVTPNSWVGPLGTTFRAYGVSRIPDLNARSLIYFAERIGLTNETEAPPSLTPLVDSLQASGVTPEAFALMPLAERIAQLKRAATTAETEADRKVKMFLSDYGAQSETSALDMAHKMDEIALVQTPYLRPELQRLVSSAAERLESLRAKHYEAWRTFSHELPGKIASGFFTEQNTFAKTDGGWMVADASPVDVIPTLTAAYAQRIATLDRFAAGPWSTEVLDVMDKTLDRPDVRAAVAAEGGERAVSEARTMVTEARARIQARLDQPANPALVEAAAAMRAYQKTGRRPAPRHVARIRRHYADSMREYYYRTPSNTKNVERYETSGQPAMTWRLDAAIDRPGYPAWNTLQGLAIHGEKISARLRTLGFTATFGLILTLLISKAIPIFSIIVVMGILTFLAWVANNMLPPEWSAQVERWNEWGPRNEYEKTRSGRFPDGHFGGPYLKGQATDPSTD